MGLLLLWLHVVVQCGTKTTGDNTFTGQLWCKLGEVQGLTARQTIREALSLSDRRCLQPYKGT